MNMKIPSKKGSLKTIVVLLYNNMSIFGGKSARARFADIFYSELMKREFVTLADIMCLQYGRPKGVLKQITPH